MSRNPIDGMQDLLGGPESPINRPSPNLGYLNYNPETGVATFANASANTGSGGAAPSCVDIEVKALASASALCGGALYCHIDRAVGQDFVAASWDSNPDTSLKVYATNYAVNAASKGALQGASIQARNRGTYLAWVKALDVNARCDVGKFVDSLYGAFIMLESYGTINTEAIGLDVNMSIAGALATGSKTAVRIRNTDASAMVAVGNVFSISHTSTNGFTYLFKLGSATGDTFTVGTRHGSGGADILCDGYLTILVNATPYYIPVYDS